MASWNSGWLRTDLSGVYASNRDLYRIRVRLTDPRSGRLREANRIVRASDLEQARAQRAVVRTELEAKLRAPPRRCVAEFGRAWLRVKQSILDEGTYDRYRHALEKRVFPRLGRIDMDELRALDVQEWINAELARGYRLTTVKGWFRVFRSMIQDAIEDVGLLRDPTRRVHFPIERERAERNALLPHELNCFLGEMKRRFPQHHALAATLAYTGLRFCHASALRWEDFDEEAAILRIERRQLRGQLRPVTSVKSAPKEYPVSAELLAILQKHRRHGRRRPRVQGWMFPSRTLPCPSSLQKAWRQCLAAIGLNERFTVHGLPEPSSTWRAGRRWMEW